MSRPRVALVTGGGKRLGRAIAERLAADGWRLAIHYLGSRQEAEALAARLPGAFAIGANLADPAEAEALPKRAAEVAGAPIEAVVNSASAFEHDEWSSVTPEAFRKVMDLNALAPALIAKQMALALPEHARGVIVNLLDYKLAQPYPDHFSYTLSKYALLGATELLARALAPRIRVNAIAPGYVLPAPGQSQADFERLHAQTPLARGAEDTDVAEAAAFLVESPVATGQTIYVDAGLRFRSQERDFAFQ